MTKECKCELFYSKKPEACRFAKYPDDALCGDTECKPADTILHINWQNLVDLYNNKYGQGCQEPDDSDGDS